MRVIDSPMIQRHRLYRVMSGVIPTWIWLHDITEECLKNVDLLLNEGKHHDAFGECPSACLLREPETCLARLAIWPRFRQEIETHKLTNRLSIPDLNTKSF